MATSVMGYPSIFKHKKGGSRYQGNLTKEGSRRFEESRKRLRQIARWPRPPTDADVIEYLARGEGATMEYILDHERT